MLGHALKRFWRERGANCLVVCILALGIAPNTAMFVVLNADVLHPLEYDHSSRLVFIWEKGNMGAGDSALDFIDWVSANRVFESMALYRVESERLESVSASRVVTVGEISSDFFSVLHVSPSLGRPFVPSDNQQFRPSVAILSARLWRDEYHSDVNVIGTLLRIEGQDLTVVGIVDAGHLYDRLQVWIPVAMDPSRTPRADRSFQAIGCLKATVNLQQAQANMNVIESRLESMYPQSNTGWHVTLQPVEEELVRHARPTAYLLFMASASVLLLTCINVSAFFLIGASRRSREFAIRMALGAGRTRIFRELFFETLLLCLTGEIVGVGFCVWGWKTMVTALPITVARPSINSWNLGVFLFASGLTLLAAVLVSVVPAWRVSNQDLAPLFHEGTSPLLHLKRPSIQSMALVFQISAAVALTVCTSLVVRSFLRIRYVDLGFDPRNLMVITPELSHRTPGPGAGQNVYFADLLESLGAERQFSVVAAVSDFPLSGTTTHHLAFLSQDRRGALPTIYCAITPKYFDAMGIPLLKGRVFTEGDRNDTQHVVIVSLLAAQRFWHNDNPIGQELLLDGMDTVVGVVDDVKWLASDVGYQPLQPEVYVPSSQAPNFPLATLVVRTRGSTQEAIRAAQRVPFGPDEITPSADILFGEQIISETAQPQQQYSMLLGGFAIMALALAAIGIYSLFSNVVTSRRREIAVRIALGAHPHTIWRLVLKDGILAIATGIIGGVIGAFFLAKLLREVLYEVSSQNVETYFVTAFFFMAIAVATLIIHARRASRIAPSETLRQ